MFHVPPVSMLGKFSVARRQEYLSMDQLDALRRDKEIQEKERRNIVLSNAKGSRGTTCAQAEHRATETSYVGAAGPPKQKDKGKD